MARSNRNSADVVDWLHRLEAEPHRFGFLPVLRKLEAIYDEKPRLGETTRPIDDSVRIGQCPSLAFAPTSIAAFKSGGGPLAGRLENYFFGLFGPNGPMPIHISEYAHSREFNEKDRTLRRFADIFHHRLSCFFYRASANGEPVVNMDRPTENRFDMYVGAMLGVGPEAMRERDAMPDAAKLHNAARLSLQTRPAEGLLALLENYFELQFSLQELVGEWLTLARDDRLRLGLNAQGTALGVDTIIGEAVWSCQHKFRVLCGPLDLEDFSRLLPGASSVGALVALVRNYLGDEFSWDLQLILRKDAVPGMVLGSAGQLGWTSWLGERSDPGDAADVIVDLQNTDLARVMN